MRLLAHIIVLLFVTLSSLEATKWDEVIAHRCPRSALCKTLHEGKNYWIKRPDPKKFTLTNMYWRKFLGLIIPIELLKPYVITSPTKLADLELKRNELFKKNEIAVPTFVHRNGNTLVLTDEGYDIEALLRMEKGTKLRATLLKQVVNALSQLHGKGLYHGRPLLKDMVYHDETVYFIDLAEAHCPHLTIPQAQARDLILFVYGALPFVGNNDDQILEILSAYNSPHKAKIMKHIAKTMKYLGPVRSAIKPVAKFLGNDTTRAIAAHKALSKLSG